MLCGTRDRMPPPRGLSLTIGFAFLIGALLPRVSAADDCITPPNLFQLREKIQLLVQQEEQLDGVRIDCIYDDHNVLRLRGILAAVGQEQTLASLIQKNAEQLGEINSAFRDRAKWSLGPWQIVDVDRYRLDLQAVLARDPLLCGTRVDRVYFDSKGNPALIGVWWVPQGIDKPIPEDLSLKTRDAAMRLTAMSWSDYATQGPAVNVDGLRKQRANPVAEIRDVIMNDAALDGMRVDETYYDSRGYLVFSGAYVNEEQWKRLQQTLTDKFSADSWRAWAKSPKLMRFAAKYRTPEREMLSWLVASIRDGNVSEDPQRVFLDKVRIDRLFYNQDNQLSMLGIRWNELDSTQQQALMLSERLRGRIEAEVQSRWPEALPSERFRSQPTVNVDQVALIEFSVLHTLREFVARQDLLDGIRLEAAYYDGPILHVIGLASNPGQIEFLKTLLHESGTQAKLLERVAPQGFEIDRLRVVPVQALLERARKRIAEQPSLPGVWVSRCFYDEQLKLTFTVVAWNKKDLPLIEESIQTELRSDPEWAAVPGSNSKEGVQVKIVGLQEDLLAVLREQVANRVDLNGVRLDRAFYDQSRVLHLAAC